MDKPDSVLGIKVKLDPSIPGLAKARGIWPFRRIYIGQRWYMLTDRQQMAVLMHEAGHCKMFHLEKRVAMRWLSPIRSSWVLKICMEQEFEADEFAAQQGYGLALIEILNELDLVTTPSNSSFGERASRILATTPFLHPLGLPGIPQAVEAVQKGPISRLQ